MAGASVLIVGAGIAGLSAGAVRSYCESLLNTWNGAYWC